MSRLVQLALGLVALLACSGPDSEESFYSACVDCNVVLITIDTLRPDHMPCYGYSENTSPNLCALGEQGVRFERAISQSSWTLPAHASIMTGVYPHDHRAENFRQRMRHLLPTLAEALKGHGYSTSAFVSTAFVDKNFGFGRGFDHFDNSQSLDYMDISSEILTNLALDVLRKTPGKFFTWIHYFDPHDAFMYHESSGFPYKAGVDATTEVEYRDWNVFPYPEAEYFNEHRDRYISLYDGEIFFVDLHIGRLIDYLKENGIFDRTIIVVTSDHGESFYEHELVGHDNFLYQDLIHVPLILYSPGLDPSVVESLVETRTIMPTLLELLGISEPEDRGGTLLSGIDAAFSEVHNRNAHRRISINKDDWKLVYSLKGDEYRLYDLADDPNEQNDLSEARPEVVERLQAQLFDAMGVVAIDEETRRRLRSLGYGD